MEQIFKNVPASNPQRIHDLTMKLKSKGLDLDTVACIGCKLSQLDRETDLNDPMKAAFHISELESKKTKKPLCNATKNKFVNAYNHYVKEYGLKWKKPYSLPS